MIKMFAIVVEATAMHMEAIDRLSGTVRVRIQDRARSVMAAAGPRNVSDHGSGTVDLTI